MRTLRFHSLAFLFGIALAFSARAGNLADVVAVSVTGKPGVYTFSVTLASPDLGCKQFADWWEVLDASGNLLYRRVLLHSHVTEQPFERAGGPVPVQDDSIIWIRAHMHPSGYGGKALKGTVRNGFTPSSPPAGFGARLDRVAPLPDSCAF